MTAFKALGVTARVASAPDLASASVASSTMPFADVLAAAGAAGTFSPSVTAFKALGVTARVASVPFSASASVASSTTPALSVVAAPGAAGSAAIASVLADTDFLTAARSSAVAASCVRSSIPSVPSGLPLSW